MSTKPTSSLMLTRLGNVAVVAIALASIVLHLVLRFLLPGPSLFGLSAAELPLVGCLMTGGTFLVLGLVRNLLRAEFGSDLLAGMAIVVSAILGEYLAGTLVVLMLSGGETLESYALRSASSVLSALARRMPTVVHRQHEHGDVQDISTAEVRVGDRVVVFPHEVCPVDGTVVTGRGSMDESYLTGEPYVISKIPGSSVLSGAINGESALVVAADKLPTDSRYAQIMNVMRSSVQERPRLRRLGDQLGAIYTPVALLIAGLAWFLSGDSVRFLAVLVVATPCPLLIAIPVAIIGSISLAARRGIIIKDPSVLERIATCKTAIFDKTGTLTYGQPMLTEIIAAPGMSESELLSYVGSVERYSKHPLAQAVLKRAKEEGVSFAEATDISEPPGMGLSATLSGRRLVVTNRKKLRKTHPALLTSLPDEEGGMECVILMDDQFAGLFRFRDEPRSEGERFVRHLKPKHRYERVMIVSGDRENEVRHLAEKVGITTVYAEQSPEQKLDIVKRETAESPTIFLGDGVNDAPALTAATVGIAFGTASDVTSEAAGAVVLDSSLERVDELFHIGGRMRRIALQSAVGGMSISGIGMLLAAWGYLPPVAGALAQEMIDVVAVLNALRAAWQPRDLIDYE